MAIHGVLIQRNHQVDVVAEAVDSFGAGADSQESMTAANDRLIRVISENMQAAPGEYVARRRHTLTRRASNGDGEGMLHFQSSLHGREGNAAMKPGTRRAPRPISPKRLSRTDRTAPAETTGLRPPRAIEQAAACRYGIVKKLS